MVNIGILISGNGTNLQALIDNIKKDKLKGRIQIVISNKRDAYGLKRAERAGIENIYLDRKDYPSIGKFNERILEELRAREVGLVVLAGYLDILPPEFVQEFKGRIINTHPSLIPSFSGKGYYGDKIHQEVLERGVKISGATVHFVDEGTDTGPIILQSPVEVESSDTIDSLRKKVLALEHKLLPKAVKLFCENRLVIEGRKVKITEVII